MEDRDTPFEKKTERLDIRLSHNKKQAFAQACENQGDTPSSAVRRFITTYIRRERRDAMAATIRFSNWKRNLGLGALALAATASGFVIWTGVTAQNQKTLTAKNFEIYDTNKNGVLDIEEIASNDSHLHRVLNIDGVDGISPKEFALNGKMIWNFVPENGFQLVEDKQGRFKQTSITTSPISVSGEALDLNTPRFLKIDGEFVEVPKGVSVVEFMKSQKGSLDDILYDMEPRIKRDERSSGQQALQQKYKTKIVSFDLRNPDRRQINVFEQQVSDLAISSIESHQRSVVWVEGRKTPEHVMGSGRENAVLTKSVGTEYVQ